MVAKFDKKAVTHFLYDFGYRYAASLWHQRMDGATVDRTRTLEWFKTYFEYDAELPYRLLELLEQRVKL